ncbi:SRPBCC family protein [Sphingobacterium thalpophilum]|uniref:SRPBCC domain-containing protein n=2 Tax=Sphingobacterium thalpophilum TaxID=259 RepID=A0ABV4HFL3_9SPHI|nr:SRPBCC domain-containing protein [Sphingobacterium thalpophilum]
MMKKLTYQLTIDAPAEHVFKTMLAKETYKQWTSAFNPTSDFEGSWEKGEKIYFVGMNEKGEKEGMVARIAENIPNQYLSIQHYGILDNGQEVTEGPAVESWAGAFENYSFIDLGNQTTVKVDVDTNEEYIDYFEQAWPDALKRLKEICETP